MQLNGNVLETDRHTEEPARRQALSCREWAKGEERFGGLEVGCDGSGHDGSALQRRHGQDPSAAMDAKEVICWKEQCAGRIEHPHCDYWANVPSQVLPPFLPVCFGWAGNELLE